MNEPIVDIHCHTFNADDLPVRGFISHVAAHGSTLGRVLAVLIDAVVQGQTPGYEEERARLDALLVTPEDRGIHEEALVREAAVDPQLRLEADTERTLRELQDRSAPLLLELDAAMRAEYPSETVGPDFVIRGFDLGMVTRAIRWVQLFARYRLELTELLMATIGDRVDVFCPLSVDLGTALGDEAKTTGREQMDLQEKISRLSMRGALPSGRKARVHPFVAFDPMREVKARAIPGVETPLELAQVAVRDFGFIGVKLYPPMGWRPIGNKELVWLTPPVGEDLDEALRDLYRWCQDQHVPLVAHCNRSNFASEQVADLAAPDGWVDVLTEYPNLRLNLGHFGGIYPANSQEPGHDWGLNIAAATDTFDHLYVDVGNHAVYDEELMADYGEQLEAMFVAHGNVRGRIMFGSDWYMEALHPEADEFLADYEEFFQRWGQPDVEGFLGGRAIRFLGFDDPDNLNNQRLRKRYQDHAKDNMPSWLAAPQPMT